MTRHGLTAIQRFNMKVKRTATCWLWQAAISEEGYGVFGPRPGKSGKAHRFSYEHYVGPIPSGLQIDHLCRVRHCVNPAHLEPVTQAENVRRGFLARGYTPKPPRPVRMSPADAGRALAAQAPPITDEQALQAARILASSLERAS